MFQNHNVGNYGENSLVFIYISTKFKKSTQGSKFPVNMLECREDKDRRTIWKPASGTLQWQRHLKATGNVVENVVCLCHLLF